MFDEKTILARLQNGEDAQTIANEMADLINKANKTYTDQKAAEEAAKKQNEIQKKEDLQEILDMFADWFHTYYGIEAKEDLKADVILEAIVSIQEYVAAIKDLEKVLKVKPAKKIVPAKSADETINQFLKSMGW